jgi:hypothetical protein
MSPSLANATTELNNQRKMLVDAFWRSTKRFVAGKKSSASLDKQSSVLKAVPTKEETGAPALPIETAPTTPQANFLETSQSLNQPAVRNATSHPDLLERTTDKVAPISEEEDENVLSEVDRLLNDLDFDFGENGANDLGSFEGNT